MRRPVFGDSDQVRHKSCCTVTEDNNGLAISELGNGGIVLAM